MTVVVTGANGELGRSIVQGLIRASTGERIVATVRDVDAAGDLTAQGVSVLPGSFDDPSNLARAFAGADTVFVNATFFGVAPELRGQRVANAIDAAAKAGASRILLTTWPDLDNCPMPVIADYRESEALIRAAGPAWTVLRLGYGIADAVGRDVLWGIKDGELVAPAGKAATTPAAISDLAEAGVAAILSNDYNGRVLELSGPNAVTWSDLAGLASELSGRDIRYRDVTDDEYREFLAARDLHPALADSLVGLYSAFRSGWDNTPTDQLATLIGHAPTSGIDAVRLRVQRQLG
jgi:NAD(P)H dehydrogenase (quinone)